MYQFYPKVRFGNKYKDIKFFKHLMPAPENVKCVAEPFAGTFAVIRHSYPKVEKLICGENDEEFLKSTKSIFDNCKEYLEYNKKYNQLIKELMLKYPDDKHVMFNKNKEQILKFIDDNKGNLLIDVERDVYSLGFISKKPEKDYSGVAEIFNRINWMDDYKKVFEACKDDKDCFMFVDPPYMSSDNTTYYGNQKSTRGKKVVDNTAIFIDIIDLLKVAKCKVMVVINKNCLNNYLFKDFIKGEYEKKYSMTKKIETLLILGNY